MRRGDDVSLTLGSQLNLDEVPHLPDFAMEVPYIRKSF